MPIPEPLRDPPIIPEGLEIFWVAYCEISTDRPMGFGAAPIPWSSTQRWGEVHALDTVQMDLLHTHLRAMDSGFLAYYEEKEKKKKDSKLGKPKRKGLFGRGK